MVRVRVILRRYKFIQVIERRFIIPSRFRALDWSRIDRLNRERSEITFFFFKDLHKTQKYEDVMRCTKRKRDLIIRELRETTLK